MTQAQSAAQPVAAAAARPAHFWSTLKSVAPYLWHYRWRIVVALSCLVAAKLANISVPLILKEIVDSLDREQALLVVPVALLIGYGTLRLSATLFQQLRDVVFERVAQRAMREAALQTFRHLHVLSLRFHLERQSGGVSRDVERGTRGVYNLLGYSIFNILPTLLEVSLVCVLLLTRFDGRFAAATLATMGLYVLLTIWISEWRISIVRSLRETESKASSRAMDSLLNYETVKYFGNEELEARLYDQHLTRYEHAAVKSETSLGLLNGAQSLSIALGLTVLMWFAADGVASGKMSVGDLVLVNTLLIQLSIPLNFLGMTYREIKLALVDMERMFKLLGQSREVADVDQAPELRLQGGEVRFEHVDFAYDARRSILHDVDFVIPPGRTLAVVGASGAGKSTLSRLLFRFYDVSAGRILIDGQDIRSVRQDSLRSAIGIVPQDTVLFNDTIYYNIAYGRPEADREAVIDAAKAAHIHEFIAALPDGYETTVGERGLKLSGGEKQRVAIARTLLKNPTILIFDEATSALDTRTEKIIQAELGEIARQRTTLVIAHRLSTVVNADEILVLDKGRVVERGHHEALLALGGRYAQLWALQLREQAEPREAHA